MNITIATIINALVFIVCVIYIGNGIYKTKFQFQKSTNIIAVLAYILYIIINEYIKNKVLKIMTTFIILIGLYKIIYKQNYDKSIIGAFWLYIIMLISETITGIAISIISYILHIDLLTVVDFENTIYMNSIIVILMLIIFQKSKYKIADLMTNNKNCKNQSNIIIYVSLLLTSTMIINKIHITNWKLNYELVTNIIVFIVFLLILIYVNKQNNRIMNIKEKYIELAEYAKLNDELLEEYRLKSHEFSNQLAIIKTMHDENNKEISNYLNGLIQKNKKHKYSWINEVKYIQLSGLKGLLNFKIMEIKNANINLQLNISKETEKFKFDKFKDNEKDDLYSIVGVYLDNAKDASEKSTRKEIIIESYLEKDNLIIVIGNTYSGKINMDKLGEYNYSTKGGNHGIGLYLVKNIIKSNTKITVQTEIRDKYFCQILTIKSNKEHTNLCKIKSLEN